MLSTLRPIDVKVIDVLHEHPFSFLESHTLPQFSVLNYNKNSCDSVRFSAGGSGLLLEDVDEDDKG